MRVRRAWVSRAVRTEESGCGSGGGSEAGGTRQVLPETGPEMPGLPEEGRSQDLGWGSVEAVSRNLRVNGGVEYGVAEGV